VSDPFEGLVGQPGPRARLTAALERPAHAYLLTGPAGSGVDAFVRRFAAALIGVEERMLEVGHPDLREIRAEGTQLRIDQVRELWHDIHLRPFSTNRRVYVIWDADAMQETVQHALLKSIEEPPEYVVVILVTARPHLLLPTVRSRTQLVAFGRLTADEIRAALEADGVEPDDAASWARVAGGDLSRARELAAGGAPAKRRALYLDLARAALIDPAFDAGAAASKIDRAAAKRGDEEATRVEQEAAARLDALGELPPRERRRLEKEAEELAKRRRRAAHVAETRAAVDVVASWYRDVVAASLGAGDAVVNSDRRTALEEDAAAGAGAPAARALDAAREVGRSLSMLTITPALAVEGLFQRVWLEAARSLSHT
jgi:DNA polymerase III subunit delta'